MPTGNLPNNECAKDCVAQDEERGDPLRVLGIGEHVAYEASPGHGDANG